MDPVEARQMSDDIGFPPCLGIETLLIESVKSNEDRG